MVDIIIYFLCALTVFIPLAVLTYLFCDSIKIIEDIKALQKECFELRKKKWFVDEWVKSTEEKIKDKTNDTR